MTSSRALAVALLTLILVSPALASATDASDRKVALGVSMAVADSQSLATVDEFTSNIGHVPALWAVWSDWGSPNNEFPTDFVNGLQARGIVPMINWEPINPANQTDCANWSLDSTIRGDHDDYIRAWATAARNYGGRVVVRFAHEMNGYWFIWGLGRCTNTAAKFRAAWRHVWNIFKGPYGVGATNVQFLWSVIGTRGVLSVWPGRKYVDYMGLTAFNWAQPGHPSWRSMVRTMAPTMSTILGLSKKPIIVAEMAAGYNPSCAICDKVAYITKGYPAVYAKWPRIVGMVYFNIDMRSQGHPDWRLDSPTGAVNAYKSVVADFRFQGNLP